MPTAEQAASPFKIAALQYLFILKPYILRMVTNCITAKISRKSMVVILLEKRRGDKLSYLKCSCSFDYIFGYRYAHFHKQLTRLNTLWHVTMCCMFLPSILSVYFDVKIDLFNN